jgi:deoxyadenosine/deoxycytidine kinase
MVIRIAIEGIPAAGKTSLASIIETTCKQAQTCCTVHSEYIPKKLLKLFYEDPKKYAFSLQLFMLPNRLWPAMTYKNKDRVIVSDRSPTGDFLFAHHHMSNNNITEEEWMAYNQIRTDYGFSPFRPFPDIADENKLVVFMATPPDAAFDRITNVRKRPEEKEVVPEYMSSLSNIHGNAMMNIIVFHKDIDVIVVFPNPTHDDAFNTVPTLKTIAKYCAGEIPRSRLPPRPCIGMENVPMGIKWNPGCPDSEKWLKTVSGNDAWAHAFKSMATAPVQSHI